MRFLSGVKPTWATMTREKSQARVESPTSHSESLGEKEPAFVSAGEGDSDVAVDPDVQHGVQVAQAVNQVWTTRALIIAYIL